MAKTIAAAIKIHCREEELCATGNVGACLMPGETGHDRRDRHFADKRNRQAPWNLPRPGQEYSAPPAATATAAEQS